MIIITNLHVTDNARLAQSVERGTFNPEVKGSSPLSGETFSHTSQLFYSRKKRILNIFKANY